MMESDPQKMVALLLGIPGARLIELRGTDDTLDLLIETEDRPVVCPECGLKWTPISGQVVKLVVTE